MTALLSLLSAGNVGGLTRSESKTDQKQQGECGIGSKFSRHVSAEQSEPTYLLQFICTIPRLFA